MRIFFGFATYALAGAIAIAADNPAAGRWKLNTAMSTLKGCPSSVIRSETLIVPADIATATARGTKRAGVAGIQPVVSRTNVSSDGRILTLTPASPSDCRIVYDRQ